MDFKKFGNFNWIKMDSKVQNLDLTRTKRIHFCPFQSIFVCWVVISPASGGEGFIIEKLDISLDGVSLCVESCKSIQSEVPHGFITFYARQDPLDIKT